LADISIIDHGIKGGRLEDGDRPIHGGVQYTGVGVLSRLVEPEGKGLGEGDVSRVETLFGYTAGSGSDGVGHPFILVQATV